MATLVIVFVVCFFMFMGLAGLIAIGMASGDAKRLKEMEANPGPILDGLFDGAPQVVYAPNDSSGGLTTATLLTGASAHGYRMVQETGQMGTRSLVFEKTT